MPPAKPSDILTNGKRMFPKGAILLLTALSPSLPVYLLGVNPAQNLLAAMFTMHWVFMGFIPLMYIYLSDDSKYYLTCVSTVKKNFKQLFTCDRNIMVSSGHVHISMVCGVTLILLSPIPPLLFRCGHDGTSSKTLCLPDVTQRLREEGFEYLFGLKNTESANQKTVRIFLAIICALYFAVVNPIIEEFFWRVFIPHSLRDLATIPKSAKETLHDGSTGNNPQPTQLGRKASFSDDGQMPLLDTREKSTCNEEEMISRAQFAVIYIIANVCYALYHMVALYCVLPRKTSERDFLYALSFFILVFFGIAMSVTISKKGPSGILSAIILHSSLDIAVVTVIIIQLLQYTE